MSAPVPDQVLRRLPALDAVRVIGALAVVGHHVGFATGRNTGDAAVGAWLARLDVGVAVFFVLSGFLLFRPYAHARATGRRPPAHRRGTCGGGPLRILPAYWVAVVVCLLVLPQNRPASTGDWLRHLTLTQIYQHGQLRHGLSQTWSLATEVTFYLLLPVLAIVLLGRRRPAPTRRVGPPGPGAADRAGRDGGHRGLGGVDGARACSSLGLHTMWLPSYAGWFGAGMALAGAHVALRTGRGERWRWLDDLGRAPWPAGRSPWARWRSPPPRSPAPGTWPSRPPASSPPSWCSTWSSRCCCWCRWPSARRPAPRASSTASSAGGSAAVSYGLFLWHPFVLEGIYLVDGRPEFTGDLLGTFALTVVGGLVLAAVSYYAVERPFQRWGASVAASAQHQREPEQGGGGDRGQLRQPGGVPPRVAAHQPASAKHATGSQRTVARRSRCMPRRSGGCRCGSSARPASTTTTTATATPTAAGPPNSSNAPPPTSAARNRPRRRRVPTTGTGVRRHGSTASRATPASSTAPAPRASTYPSVGGEAERHLAGDVGRHQPALLPAVHHERGEGPAGGGGHPPGVGVLPQRQHPLAGVVPQAQHPTGGRPLVDPQRRPGRPGCRGVGRRAAGPGCRRTGAGRAAAGRGRASGGPAGRGAGRGEGEPGRYGQPRPRRHHPVLPAGQPHRHLRGRAAQHDGHLAQFEQVPPAGDQRGPALPAGHGDGGAGATGQGDPFRGVGPGDRRGRQHGQLADRDRQALRQPPVRVVRRRRHQVGDQHGDVVAAHRPVEQQRAALVQHPAAHPLVADHGDPPGAGRCRGGRQGDPQAADGARLRPGQPQPRLPIGVGGVPGGRGVPVHHRPGPGGRVEHTDGRGGHGRGEPRW